MCLVLDANLHLLNYFAYAISECFGEPEPSVPDHLSDKYQKFMCWQKLPDEMLGIIKPVINAQGPKIIQCLLKVKGDLS